MNAEPVARISPILGAANGDGDDLRSLAAVAYEPGARRLTGGRIAAFAEALSFTRLAAVGGTQKDLQAVIFLCGRIAEECRNTGDLAAGDAYDARGFLLAELMAQAGDEAMAAMVAGAGAAVTASAHCEARRLLDGERGS